MNNFSLTVLVAWFPLVLIFYNFMPRRRAVANLFVAAWLLLPYSGLNFAGLPPYTKVTATVLSVFTCTLLFDSRMLFSVRFRWFDWPAVIWCAIPLVSAVTNGLSAKQGLSAFLGEVMGWGLPYLFGRIYLNDSESLTDMVRAIVMGGLFYVPLCLFEIRFGPMLANWIYGFTRWEGVRYGGYRPKVFLSHGLELGIWMTDASLMVYALWSSGAVKAIRGVGIGALAAALLATTILCKSTGALGLLAIGIFAFWSARRYKKAVLVWALIAIAPTYCVVRTLDLWSGRQVVDLAKATVGDERAQSFEFRLDMERVLLDHALQHPIFGWGGEGRNLVYNQYGVSVTVPDGWWVIAVGCEGVLGLSSMLAMFLLPMIVTLRRFPVSTWHDPRVLPSAALSMMLVLTMIDCLSNAMIMAIFPLVIGGVLGQPTELVGVGTDHAEAEGALAEASGLVASGRMAEAGLEFRRAIGLAEQGEGIEALHIRAEALDGLGHSLMADGRPEEAATAFREALAIRDELAAESPDPDHFRDLAIARDGLSRALAEAGMVVEAIDERQIALQTWEILSANHPRDLEYRRHLVDSLNDLAWLLATEPAASHNDPARALGLAEEAVRISADHDALWNTLGVARYRAGDWAGAIEALERSAVASPGGQGTAFDHYFLAMAWYQLGHADQAGEWLERGAAWAVRHRPGHPGLARFRGEAEATLGGDHAEPKPIQLK